MNYVDTGSVWQHLNGHRYKVLCTAMQNDGDDLREVIVHVGLHDGRTWVRDVKNFLGRHASGELRFNRIS